MAETWVGQYAVNVTAAEEDVVVSAILARQDAAGMRLGSGFVSTTILGGVCIEMDAPTLALLDGGGPGAVHGLGDGFLSVAGVDRHVSVRRDT